MKIIDDAKKALNLHLWFVGAVTSIGWFACGVVCFHSGYHILGAFLSFLSGLNLSDVFRKVQIQRYQEAFNHNEEVMNQMIEVVQSYEEVFKGLAARGVIGFEEFSVEEVEGNPEFCNECDKKDDHEKN